MDVEGRAEVFARHRRAFDVPAGKADAPGAVPAQNVLRLGPLPQGEVRRMALFVAHGLAAAGLLLLEHAVGKLAVALVRGDVEVDVAVHVIGVAGADELLDHDDLFGHVGAGAGRDVGPLHAQRVHVGEVAAGVGLDDLHRARLHLARLAQDAVLAAVQQMTDVGQVLHVEDVPGAVTQPADHHVEGDVGAGVADVRVVVDGGATDVEVDLALRQRFKGLFLASEHVEQLQGHEAPLSSPT